MNAPGRPNCANRIKHINFCTTNVFLAMQSVKAPARLPISNVPVRYEKTCDVGRHNSHGGSQLRQVSPHSHNTSPVPPKVRRTLSHCASLSATCFVQQYTVEPSAPARCFESDARETNTTLNRVSTFSNKRFSYHIVQKAHLTMYYLTTVPPGSDQTHPADSAELLSRCPAAHGADRKYMDSNQPLPLPKTDVHPDSLPAVLCNPRRATVNP